MDDQVQDYLFDLQGYLVLKNAISAADLREMNQWIDGHASYIEEPWSTDGYNEENGVNFQSIIEGGPVFEKLIDHPAWIDLVKKYIHSSANGLSIHEKFSQRPWPRRLPPHPLRRPCSAQLSDVFARTTPENGWSGRLTY